MSADDPCGTIQLELETLRLCLLGPKQEELQVRIDFELMPPDGISRDLEVDEDGNPIDAAGSALKWSDGAKIFSTGAVTAFIEEPPAPLPVNKEIPIEAVADGAEEEAKPEITEEGGNDTEVSPEGGEATDGCANNNQEPEPEKTFYVFGFIQSGFKKTQLIDFTSDIMANACNSNIKVRVLKLPTAAEVEAAEAAHAAPAKGKGAPPPTEEPPLETVMIECTLPITKLFGQKTSSVSCDFTADGSLNINSTNDLIKIDESTIQLRVSMDNELSEFTYGCAFITISECKLTTMPVEFTLKCDDIIDPKAKVPPTEEELRTKYIENVATMVADSSHCSSYSVSLSEIDRLIPATKIQAAEIQFDSEAAKEVPLEDDIRARTDLWTYVFANAPVVFLHRSQVRSLLSLSPHELVISGTLFKQNEGADPISATFNMDLLPITEERVVSIPVKASVFLPAPPVTEEDVGAAEETNNAQESSNLETGGCFNAIMTASRPLNDSAPKVSTTDNDLSSSAPGSSSQAKSNIADPSKDVLKEFRMEIEEVVKQVALEYISQYPNPLGTASEGGVEGGDSITTIATQSKEMEQRKSAFMYYLSSQGIYHEFKEKLKPRIQRVVRKEYGPRGAALKGHAWKDDDMRREMHVLLSEIYVMLVKECTKVLNSMYKKTVVKLEQLEFDAGPSGKTINDETETDRQKFDRLLLVAQDCRSDQRVAAAEQIHLERIQFASRSKDLSHDTIALHDAYFSYALYMLNLRKYDSSEGNGFLLDRSKEILELAYVTIGDNYGPSKLTDHQSTLLLSALCIELNDLNRADFVLSSAFRNQMTSIETLSDLDGYETDGLYKPVDYMTYVILCILRSKQGFPIQARRALRLAVLSYEEENRGMSVGKPKRGGVICLAKAALYCFDRGMTSIAEMCSNFAQENDKATTAKALAKNLPADSPAEIRHYLRRAQSLVKYHSGDYTAAVDLAEESANVTDEPKLQSEGYVCAAECAVGSNSPEISLGMFLKGFACGIPLILDSYVSLTRLLTSATRFEEAVNVALKGFTYFPSSATLMTLIGINCYRLERLTEAESSLMEATLLDSHNAETWIYLSLLCLSHGDSRLEEATKSLQQALRVGAKDLKPELFRELSASFIAVDKLQIAEDLVRRTLAKELELNGKQHPTSRKLLADILNQQNLSEKAIEEYQGVLNDDTTDVESKIEVANTCLKLLVSLGRKEEVNYVENILSKLKSIEQ